MCVGGEEEGEGGKCENLVFKKRAGMKKLTILSDIKDWWSRTTTGSPNQTTSE